MIIKNRGAISNPCGRFEKKTYGSFDDGWNIFSDDDEELPSLETTLFKEFPKTIISRNDSPDLGFEQSINPYRGCEHGCIYCYARPCHSYVNLSPGLDFETKLFYKVNAKEVLEQELAKPNYICKPIVLGANTDPYQPIEAKLKITRNILETLNRYHHPVIIITKSSLVERDIDILTEMANKQIVKVAISITTLSSSLKKTLEPRASQPKARLRALNHLAEQKIPVRVMVAPIIPMITDCEMEKILQNAKTAGALHASYTLIRLPHEVKDLFREWLSTHFPERANHVMSLIRQMRGGKDYDASFNQRMRGTGEFADLIETRFTLACKRLGLNSEPSQLLNTSAFKKPKISSPQTCFWDE